MKKKKEGMRLYIGSKNYSSWSMRVWVVMTHFGIPFEEVKFRLDGFDGESNFKKNIIQVSDAAKVPVLVNNEFPVWESLSILEYLADMYPELQLWPADHHGLGRPRAYARSMCAEMHAGFTALRTFLPMNIEAKLPHLGAMIQKNHPEVSLDITRVVDILTLPLCASKGPMLFGEFSIADAYYAPVLMRFHTYGITVPKRIEEYMERVRSIPAVDAWIQQALEEKDFIPNEEPYRLSSEKLRIYENI